MVYKFRAKSLTVAFGGTGPIHGDSPAEALRTYLVGFGFSDINVDQKDNNFFVECYLDGQWKEIHFVLL